MSGRVAVVTGGSSGIGLAVVELLLEEGWRVAFFSQHAARVADARDELGARHGAARVLADALDLREGAAVEAFMRAVVARFGGIDALVCNAAFSPKGPSGRTPLVDIPLAEWNDVLAVNLTGALVCCRAVLPTMAAARSGRIVLIGSIAGRTVPRVAGASYVASKSALVGLMRSIVSEHAGQGITANTICPGRIVTEMTGDAASPLNQTVLARIPVGRLGRTGDIARTVSFLIAPEADFINGAVIDVNGGEYTAP